jgi:hypothetical protein
LLLLLSLFWCLLTGGWDAACYITFLLFFFAGMHIHGLAHAASGYHRVLEENRKLYNEVQDLKGNKIMAGW